MVVTANLTAVKQLAGRLEIGVLVRTLSGKREIFALDERQENLAPAEIDFLHGAGRQFAHPSHGYVANSHTFYAAAFCCR